MTRLSVSALCLMTVCSWTAPAMAQDDGAREAPAHVSVVDGAAILERDGRTDTDLVSMPLLAGDRIRTQGGRVEVLFADGSALHLDANTVVDFQSDEVVRLLEGRVRLSVAGPARDLSYRIDAPSAWVQISTPGEYRVGVLPDAEVELAVLRGSAELVNEQGRSYISAGERTFARAGAAPSPAYVFNSAAWDAFDRWSEARRDQRLGVSAQYLPEDVRRYAPAFDSYGTWRYEQVYGYVWYPRVQIGWRPYHRGRWISLRPYGWTWIAGDPWGWPTHHYGRWGISAGSWFWIPGRRWAPAWVSWAYAPGYVSWCPLGWNDRAIFQLNINAYGGRRYSPWDAWSVLPRHHFNTGYVNVSRLASVRIDSRFTDRFVVERRGPEGSFAVNRSSVPIRTVGRYSGYRSDPGADGVRTMRGAAAIPGGSQRGFPAAARTPGTSIAPGVDRSGDRSRPSGARAIERDGAFRQPAVPAARASESSPRSTGDGAVAIEPGYRRESGGARARRDDGNDAVVTPGVPGAVRAVPRYRNNDGSDAAPSRGIERQDRVRSAPSYQPPLQPSPAYQQPVPAYPRPSYRAAPEERRGEAPEPQGTAVPRGYSRERAEPQNRAPAGGGMPVYRQAPERQAPSGGADRAPRGGDGGSQRGGEGAGPRGGDGGGPRGGGRPSGGRTGGQARSR